MQTRKSLTALLALLVVFAANNVAAQQQPAKGMMEWGIAAGGLSYPAYPAATGRKNRALILPYLKYNSDRFSIGGASLAAVHLGQTEKTRFDFSVAASLDASSAGLPIRAGMPDLGYIFEAGPVVEYQMGTAFGGLVEARLPLRAVFTTNLSSVNLIGATFSPQLRVTWTLNKATRTEIEATLQPVFATEGVQDYFYQVDPVYATIPRPAFDAQGGYLGTEIVVKASHSLSPTLRVYGYAKIGLHSGAVNSASPLFGSNQTVTVGIALRKTLGFWKMGSFW